MTLGGGKLRLTLKCLAPANRRIHQSAFASVTTRSKTIYSMPTTLVYTGRTLDLLHGQYRLIAPVLFFQRFALGVCMRWLSIVTEEQSHVVCPYSCWQPLRCATKCCTRSAAPVVRISVHDSVRGQVSLEETVLTLTFDGFTRCRSLSVISSMLRGTTRQWESCGGSGGMSKGSFLLCLCL